MCDQTVPDYLLPPESGLGVTQIPTVNVRGAISTGSALLAAATNPIAAIMAGLNPILSVFGLNSSDPVKDRERADRINDTFRLAMQGDAEAVSCLRDMAAGVSSGPNDPRQCAVGSKTAATYAKKMWNEYQARVQAGIVGTGLIGASNLPATVAGLLTSPLTLGLGALVLILLLRRKGR